MLRHLLTALVAACCGTGAFAETVLLEENFNSSYSASFPHYFDGDSHMPHSSIQSLFLSAEHGMYMPWWTLRESSTDPDRFLGSHSYYSPAGQSDDWLISRPITIPAEGFQLEFDAQSAVLRSGNRLSDLRIFVTEQMPGNDWCPAEPDAVFEQIPAGATPDVTTGEWTRYQMSLDKWAGKTVYINFVNQNNDKDLLCLDNVKVYRNDALELTIAPIPQYTADAEVTLTATLRAVSQDISSYTVRFTDGDRIIERHSTAPLPQGQEQTLTATFPLEPCATASFTVTVSPQGMQSVQQQATTTRLAFAPTHRVLIEESTGLWCGNCPRGIYNIEALREDPNIGDLAIPVSIHVTGGGNDLMVMDEYAAYVGIQSAAPMVKLDRGSEILGFSPSHDSNYDPTDPLSFAYRVHQQQREPVFFDIDIQAQPILEQGDTTAFQAIATVRPALNLDPERYRVGFILTENNVGLDNSPYWIQSNYVAGYPFSSALGGWTQLPAHVLNMRYHYVARAIPHPGGIPASFTALQAGQDYQVQATIAIPNTLRTDSQGTLISPAIRPSQCELTAYIVDTQTGAIQNAARLSATPSAQHLFTAADLVVLPIHSPCQSQGQSQIPHDLSGRPVPNGYQGIIIRNGKKVLQK